MPAEAQGLGAEALIAYLREHVSVRIEQSFEVRIGPCGFARLLRVPD